MLILILNTLLIALITDVFIASAILVFATALGLKLNEFLEVI